MKNLYSPSLGMPRMLSIMKSSQYKLIVIKPFILKFGQYKKIATKALVPCPSSLKRRQYKLTTIKTYFFFNFKQNFRNTFFFLSKFKYNFPILFLPLSLFSSFIVVSKRNRRNIGSLKLCLVGKQVYFLYALYHNLIQLLSYSCFPT